ncbi:hypothetical protein IFM47457_05130 [Aspergillus lentulus]|nr:hypothetical protein IFM47457_05130 [Aspergillus lentulus]
MRGLANVDINDNDGITESPSQYLFRLNWARDSDDSPNEKWRMKGKGTWESAEAGRSWKKIRK